MAKFANLKSTVKEMDFKVGCVCENVYANELVWQTIQKHGHKESRSKFGCFAGLSIPQVFICIHIAVICHYISILC